MSKIIKTFRVGDVEDPHLVANMTIADLQSKNELPEHQLGYKMCLSQPDGMSWTVDVIDPSLDDPLEDLHESFIQRTDAEKDASEKFWSSLSEEQQLQDFCAVTRRIHDGDVEQRGSYRYVLYDVFGFGPEAYEAAMLSGYMDIHNLIFDALEAESKESNDHDAQ